MYSKVCHLRISRVLLHIQVVLVIHLILLCGSKPVLQLEDLQTSSTSFDLYSATSWVSDFYNGSFIQLFQPADESDFDVIFADLCQFVDNNTLREIRQDGLKEPQLEPVLNNRSYEEYDSWLHLAASNCSIHDIRPGVFAGLENLPYWFLSLYDGIQFGEVRIGLSMCLNNNELNVIQDGTFAGMESLKLLDLQNNNLQKVENNAFRSLTNLRILLISGNALTSLHTDTFQSQSTLIELTLNDNQLSHLPQDIFHNVTNLIYLDLSRNYLEEIPILSKCPSLLGLYLEGNLLPLIPSEEGKGFAGLESLISLHLQNNMIQEIENDAFRSLHGLRTLLLSGNELTSLHSYTFQSQFKLTRLILNDNRLSHFAADVFNNVTNLKYLYLSGNYLEEISILPTLTSLQTINHRGEVVKGFVGLKSLESLDLQDNDLQDIKNDTFVLLKNLRKLMISGNALTSLHPGTFQSQSKLQVLKLNDNQLSYLPDNIFHNLTKLKYLNLSGNRLEEIPTLSMCTSLQTINLKENPLLWIRYEVFTGLNETTKLLVTSYATCCYASQHVQCESDEPRSLFLTCTRLLSYDSLRSLTWIISICGILGNIYALHTRLRNKQQSNKVQVLLILNLSASDLLMCVYLIVLLSADMYYEDYFPHNSDVWRRSLPCKIAGALSVLSSEASAFLITLISINSYMCVKYRYPFGSRRLSLKQARVFLVTLWTIAFSFAIASVILSSDDSNIYAVSEVCVGLPLTRMEYYNESTVVIETEYRRQCGCFSMFTYSSTLTDQISKNTFDHSAISMYLSIAIFTGLNLICFMVVGFCYTFIFITARKTTRSTRRLQRSNDQVRQAIKMSLLVLTDFCCWVPIGILSILVQAGVVTVSPEAYVWIATFVLPFNSTLNPFLYTFAMLSFDKVEWPCSALCKRIPREEENIDMKEIANRKMSEGHVMEERNQDLVAN